MVVTIEQLPTGAKCAYKTLEHEAPLTQSELIDRSYLTDRTAKRALSELEEAGLVNVERPPSDLREKQYRLAESAG